MHISLLEDKDEMLQFTIKMFPKYHVYIGRTLGWWFNHGNMVLVITPYDVGSWKPMRRDGSLWTLSGRIIVFSAKWATISSKFQLDKQQVWCNKNGNYVKCHMITIKPEILPCRLQNCGSWCTKQQKLMKISSAEEEEKKIRRISHLNWNY